MVSVDVKHHVYLLYGLQRCPSSLQHQFGSDSADLGIVRASLQHSGISVPATTSPETTFLQTNLTTKWFNTLRVCNPEKAERVG